MRLITSTLNLFVTAVAGTESKTSINIDKGILQNVSFSIITLASAPTESAILGLRIYRASVDINDCMFDHSVVSVYDPSTSNFFASVALVGINYKLMSGNIVEFYVHDTNAQRWCAHINLLVEL